MALKMVLDLREIAEYQIEPAEAGNGLRPDGNS
jgi:hypothetical protein